MKFWQYDATRYSQRLEARLKKYSGGQILLITREDGEIRGPFDTYTENGPNIQFHLLWLARKRIITPVTTFCKGEWKWEITHPIVRRLACHLQLEMSGGLEAITANSPEVPGNESGDTRAVGVVKFYQNKPLWGKIPKCLHFTTILGEHGTLFQPNDPRNLRLETKEGETWVVDPTHPQPKK